MKYKEYYLENSSLMVFLHGGGVSGWMWEEQVKYFTTRYHCLVPDLPGHGTSKQDSFSIEDSAQRLIQLINEKKNDKPIIVIGFSLGAQVLVRMLSIHHHLIDYAIINSALTKPMTYSAKLIMPLFKLSFPLVKLKSFAKLQAKVLYIKENQLDLYYQDSSETSLDTFIQVMKENMSFSIPNHFYKANGKILVTVGEKEKKIMHKSAIELTHANSNATGIVIPKIGHGISLADPKFFNQLIEDWITKQILPNRVNII